MVMRVTGGRSKSITKQICIEIEIENNIISVNILVVSGLNLDLILGCGFFKK